MQSIRFYQVYCVLVITPLIFSQLFFSFWFVSCNTGLLSNERISNAISCILSILLEASLFKLICILRLNSLLQSDARTGLVYRWHLLWCQSPSLCMKAFIRINATDSIYSDLVCFCSLSVMCLLSEVSSCICIYKI